MVTVKSCVNGAVLTYIHVHRTGGSSFQGALITHPDLQVICEHRPHLDADEVLTTYGAQIALAAEGCPRRMIAVVRHPLPWLVSQWALAEHPRHEGGGHVLNGRWPDFESFARAYPAEAPGYRFQHPLVTEGKAPAGEILPDRLYRFETALERSWLEAEAFLGVALERRHENAALAERVASDRLWHWCAYYPTELIEAVVRDFRTDLDLWHEAQP